VNDHKGFPRPHIETFRVESRVAACTFLLMASSDVGQGQTGLPTAKWLRRPTGGRDSTPRWVGALRSRQRGWTLDEKLRPFVNNTEGKTNTGCIGGALPPEVCYSFPWPTAGKRAPKGPFSLILYLRRRQNKRICRFHDGKDFRDNV